MVPTRCLLVATLVVLVLAGCDAALLSLKLGFNIKRPSMAVHGATVFDVLVTPVMSENAVSFNGKVTVEQNGSTHNFYLVDNAPYHEVINGSTSVTSCQSPESVPSISNVVEAITSAIAVSSVTTDQDVSCTNGTWLSTTFAGEPYVLCTGPDANSSNFMVYGADLSVSFEYLPELVPIAKPSGSPSNCNNIKEGKISLSSLDSIYGKKLTGSHRKLKIGAGAAHLASSTCACQSTPRPCLFFHGMDVKADGGIVDDYSFFGDIKAHAPCCSSFSFAILNTVDYEWYNSTLLEKACAAAVSVSAGSTDTDSTVINDLIIVAHSMGNNVFASALAEGICSIGRNVDWVDLSGPLKGSMGSDLMHDICDGDDEGNSDILSRLGNLIGQCPGSISRRSLVYDGGHYCDDEMAARYAAARKMHEKYATASMCGTTYNGLFSKEYAGLLAGGLIIPHHSSKNDGVVGFDSLLFRGLTRICSSVLTALSAALFRWSFRVALGTWIRHCLRLRI
ncbi:unnamed protein product [Phytophthora lilii]|uniref:Unnamed protein product n=1 Tax=Phytophthora lilii TaxID=2077276 RepID=A0A9W7CGQ6_9STRA|nr:unnamed protein product [Phytophthora lilii]